MSAFPRTCPFSRNLGSRFRPAPLRSRTVGLPESGSDLGITQSAPSPSQRCLNAGPYSPLLRWGYPTERPPRFSGGSVSTRSAQAAKCPEPLCRQAVLPPVAGCRASCQRALPRLLRSYELMRQSQTLPPPTVSALVSGSLSVAASPDWERDLPDVISAELSPRVWTPTPVAPEVHLPVSSLRALAFPTMSMVRRVTTPRKRLHSGGRFRGCSHSLMFRLAGLLATLAAPTFVLLHWQWWLLRPRISRFVTSPCSGYANRPNRAIDGKRTFTSQARQPYRLRRHGPPYAIRRRFNVGRTVSAVCLRRVDHWSDLHLASRLVQNAVLHQPVGDTGMYRHFQWP